MIVFGAGASTRGAKFEELVFSRNTEVIDTTVPAGTTTDAAQPAGRISSFLLSRLLLHSPLEAGTVGPDAVQDDGDLAGDRDFAFLAPTHFISRVPHAFSADQRWVRCSRTLAASNR